METLTQIFAFVAGGLIASIVVLWGFNLIEGKMAFLISLGLAAAAAIRIVATGYAINPVINPAPAQQPSETVLPKSDSLLSPMNIRRLFSQQQADEATKIDVDLTHLFNQFDPTPLPRARPRDRGLMWHWCSSSRRMVTAQDWRDCAGKTSIPLPLISKG